MKLNCQPGDLAIVLYPKILSNLGTIVRVLHRHANSSEWDFGDEPTWWCESGALMTWTVGEEVRISNAGPIPDRCLRAIDRKGDVLGDEMTYAEVEWV